uniref:Uncharacterized protein n=1 Tax=Arundo donax TaxID=35708 RepID=A0A0A9ELN0_ARUDO
MALGNGCSSEFLDCLVPFIDAPDGDLLLVPFHPRQPPLEQRDAGALGDGGVIGGRGGGVAGEGRAAQRPQRRHAPAEA